MERRAAKDVFLSYVAAVFTMGAAMLVARAGRAGDWGYFWLSGLSADRHLLYVQGSNPERSGCQSPHWLTSMLVTRADGLPAKCNCLVVSALRRVP